MIGGGQLGRYAIIAARQMGYRTIVLDPNPDAPAGAVADVHLIADYDDPSAIAEIARAADVATVEFENPPAATIEALAESIRVAPSPLAIAVAQDRIEEKRFLESIGCAVGRWAPLEVEADLVEAAALDGAVILKTARLGYDGKGQRVVDSSADLELAWHELGGVRCVVEVAQRLVTEVSAIVARSTNGEFAAFPVAENVHRNGILDLTVVPAAVDSVLLAAADSMAQRIAEALDYVGVLAVEFFVVDGEAGPELLVNELAPRPHNSGHWTLDAAAISQFEQQIRAVCGLPLGGARLVHPAAAMVNLLGDLWAEGEPRWSLGLADDVALHLYGKGAARPGRKMGHLTAWGDRDVVVDRARSARAAVATTVV